MASETNSIVRDVQDDKKLMLSVTKLRTRVSTVKEIVDKCLEKDLYTNATPEDRVKYDLFLAYATTSLFWAYLRTVGINPHLHPVKREVERIKTYMAKAKSVQDRHARPKVNQAAAKRFVKSALWTAPDEETSQSSNAGKKRKRSTDDES